MITQYTVRNFKSIKDDVCLDMHAAKIHENDDTIIKTGDGERYLPISVIYGPNGGGKSNILESFKALMDKLTAGDRARGELGARGVLFNDMVPYAFSSDNRDAPVEFDLGFRTQYTEYRYSAAFMHDKVIYEYLDYRKPESARMNAIFEREDGRISMKGEFQKLKIPAELSDTLSLVSYLGLFYSRDAVIGDIWKWVCYGNMVINGTPIYSLFPYTDDFQDHDAFKRKTLEMFREIDLDIADFRVVRDDAGRVGIRTVHSVAGEDTELPLEMESTGTQKLFNIVPFIIYNLELGGTLMVDELDAQLHPILLEYIIRLFTDRNINRSGAQLIFTSHDISTMRSDLFRRDEIWFAAKGNQQNTGLYSLVEFKDENGECPRADGSYARQYLKGRYGADPYLRKIISW